MHQAAFFLLNTYPSPTYTLHGLEMHGPLLGGGPLRFTFQVIKCTYLPSSPYDLQGFTQDLGVASSLPQMCWVFSLCVLSLANLGSAALLS